MENKTYSELTDQELLIEKKKLKKAKIHHAFYIGFMVGILIFGFVSWFLTEDKNLLFLIPMLIPMVFIIKMIKNPKSNDDLEAILKQRGL